MSKRFSSKRVWRELKRFEDNHSVKIYVSEPTVQVNEFSRPLLLRKYNSTHGYKWSIERRCPTYGILLYNIETRKQAEALIPVLRDGSFCLQRSFGSQDDFDHLTLDSTLNKEVKCLGKSIQVARNLCMPLLFELLTAGQLRIDGKVVCEYEICATTSDECEFYDPAGLQTLIYSVAKAGVEMERGASEWTGKFP